jgi:hypothetical protein
MYKELFPKRSFGVEIGVLRAINAENIFRIVRPREFHLVDAWNPYIWTDDPQEPHTKDFFDKALLEALPKILKMGPSVHIHRTVSIEAAKTLPDEYFDWVYVDAHHTCQGLVSDFKAWFPKIKDGGIFAGHDLTCCPDTCELWHFPGIKLAINNHLLQRRRCQILLDGYAQLIGYSLEHFHSFALRILKEPHKNTYSSVLV